MISEERVKLMTRMAIYESGDGDRDIEIGQYQKKQYIRVEVLKSVLYSTVFYWCLVGLILLLFMQYVVGLVVNSGAHRYMMIIGGLYILFSILNGLITRRRAGKEYDESMDRLKDYKKNLNRLYFEHEIKAKPEDTKPKDLKEKLEEELNADNI